MHFHDSKNRRAYSSSRDSCFTNIPFLQPTDYAVNIHGFITLTFFMLQARTLVPAFPNKYEILKNYSPLS